MARKISRENVLTTPQLDKIIHDGFYFLSINKNAINNLNVFPVPDGDTGLNMYLTLQSPLNSLKKYNLKKLSITQYLQIFANSAILNSRGCSGVILALFIKGITEKLQTIKNSNDILNSDVASALKNAYGLAYRETTNPKEGTILTMMRVFSDSFSNLSSDGKNPIGIIKTILPILEDTLSKTPEMLPILKKAGVVDSGALGFLIILKGMFIGMEYNGTIIKPLANISSILMINRYIKSILLKNKHRKKSNIVKTILMSFPTKNINNLSLANILKQVNKLPQKDDRAIKQNIVQKSNALSNSWNPDLVYRYCTEFILVSDKITKNNLQRKLENIGDSLIIIQDRNHYKIHIHTNKPKVLLKQCSDYGEISSTKIDDMKKQHHNLISEDKAYYIKDKAVLIIVNGDGFAKILTGLGATDILNYGKTKPSVNHIQNALLKTRAKNVIIACDDKDILPSVKSAITFAKNNVELIETKDIIQTISMMYNYSNTIDIINNAKIMRSNLNNIKYCKIARATRNFEENDFFVNKGDYFTIYQKKIVLSETKIIDAIIQSINKIKQDESLITLYKGKIKIIDNNFLPILKSKFEDIEFEKYYGGQNRYHYYITFE